MLIKSLQLDLGMLAISALPVTMRLGLVIQKYIAIINFALWAEARIRIRGMTIEIASLSSLGTLQASIVDFYHDVVRGGVIVRKKPIIVDVGANIGQFCIAAKLFYPSARVISFEPDPDVFKLLERNVGHLEGVTLYNVGLGDKTGSLNFFVHPLSLMSSFKQYAGVSYDSQHIKKLPVRRLDALMPKGQKVDLLKIDVEGFEEQVVMGASWTLSQSARYLLMELSLGREQMSGTNISLLSKILEFSPAARVVKFGRPLGETDAPTCQDVLIRLRQQGDNA